jgi:hypothetical protein
MFWIFLTHKFFNAATNPFAENVTRPASNDNTDIAKGLAFLG